MSKTSFSDLLLGGEGKLSNPATDFGSTFGLDTSNGGCGDTITESAASFPWICDVGPSVASCSTFGLSTLDADSGDTKAESVGSFACICCDDPATFELDTFDADFGDTITESAGSVV
mmetsp:Transcript_111927/g.167589  ORF Transcript_111927/g.167589 Transcript_111927/m.167589 type:complete len:117 (+) Transcript_111927:1771-2121(+)